MNIAIPHWRGRVSPVFDVADNVLVVNIDDGAEQNRREACLDGTGVQERVHRLAGLGVNVLICGAISKPLELSISAANIDVISQICGDVECVLTAFVKQQLDQGGFLMPGCRNHRRGFLGNRRRRGACWRNERKGGEDHGQR